MTLIFLCLGSSTVSRGVQRILYPRCSLSSLFQGVRCPRCSLLSTRWCCFLLLNELCLRQSLFNHRELLSSGIGLVLYPNVVLGLSDQAGSVRAGPRVSRGGFRREMLERFHFFRLRGPVSRCSLSSHAEFWRIQDHNHCNTLYRHSH